MTADCIKLKKEYDAIIISTDHTDYDYENILEHTPLIIDTRNATKNVQNNRGKIVKV